MPIEGKKPEITSLRINRDNQNGQTNAGGGNLSQSPKWRKWAVIGGVVVVLLVALYASRDALTPAEQVHIGKVSLVYPSQASAVLTASGYVVATRKAAVASKGTGRLVFLGVEEGSHVRNDEIIGRLDASDVEAALEQAKASLIVAKDNLDNAKAAEANAEGNYKRDTVLFTKKLIAQSDMDAALALYKQDVALQASAEANVKLAEAGISAAEVQVEYTNIRAPFDGTVLTKDADVGDVMTPFGAAAGSRADIVTLADMHSLDAEVDVAESYLNQVHVGQQCEISLDAVPDKRYKGTVHMIVPTADRTKATVLTKVNFLDIDSRVLPEMSVKVLFLSDSSAATSDSAGPKLTVPAAAIVERNGKKVVYIMRGEKVTEAPVVLGTILGSGIEVIQGVTAGDTVVLNPDEKMATGTAVKIEE